MSSGWPHLQLRTVRGRGRWRRRRRITLNTCGVNVVRRSTGHVDSSGRPSNLLMEPACHSANYVDGHITSLLIQVHWVHSSVFSRAAFPKTSHLAAARLPVAASLVLSWTLVGQKVIPPGFEYELVEFAGAWTEAAAIYDRRKSSWDSATATAALAAKRRAQDDQVRLETQSKDQFLSAAFQKLVAFRTRLQKILFEGATARKDAEDDERSRWLHILAGIIQNTNTPMAILLREKPGQTQLIGAGKRASTLPEPGSELCAATPCGFRQRMVSRSRRRPGRRNQLRGEASKALIRR